VRQAWLSNALSEGHVIINGRGIHWEVGERVDGLRQRKANALITNRGRHLVTRMPSVNGTSQTIPVVLKRVPLGSLKQEFSIPGRKFVSAWNWGGKAVDEKKTQIFVIWLFTTQKLHNEVGLDGIVYSMQRQVALTGVTDVIKESVWFITVYCFFTVGRWDFCNYMFCDFCWGGIDSVWVCKGGTWKKFENHWTTWSFQSAYL